MKINININKINIKRNGIHQGRVTLQSLKLNMISDHYLQNYKRKVIHCRRHQKAAVHLIPSTSSTSDSRNFNQMSPLVPIPSGIFGHLPNLLLNATFPSQSSAKFPDKVAFQ